MEQRDHIATLCAAGTLGIAATGLALGVQAGNDAAHSTTPGKRKWPGASSIKPSSIPQASVPSRRVTSQPLTPTTYTTPNRVDLPRPTSFLRRQSIQEIRGVTGDDNDIGLHSRDSSTNRSGSFRPLTADTRSTSERRDPSTGSSWLKRISSISTPRTNSPAAQSFQPESTPQSSLSQDFGPKNHPLPNKLVKRSTSQRALSRDQAQGTFLRRPATSHQRSATIQEWIPREVSASLPATPYLSSSSEPIWRPFFERGYPRKRYVSANTRDNTSPRTISVPTVAKPTLLLGSHIGATESQDEYTNEIARLQADPKAASTNRQRLKRSLSSVHRAARRRHFTDPIVKVTTEAVNGTITPAVKRYPTSATAQTSPFDSDLPSRPLSFNSSPPFVPVRHRFSFRKRQSTAPSDPTTASSDNDTRVFTDDDSMDFQSDTAYDSLTTRATVSSHSAFRTQKLDTAFGDTQQMHPEEADTTLARLVQKATLGDSTSLPHLTRTSEQLRGIGISEIEEDADEVDFAEESGPSLIPIKSEPSLNGEYSMTPVPQRLRYIGSPLKSSPPVLATTQVNANIGVPEFAISHRREDDEDDIDWSPKSDKRGKASTSTLRQSTLGQAFATSSSPILPPHSYPSYIDEDDNETDKRLSSIFDWSEHNKFGGEGMGSTIVRPKTVHGKQGPDGSRSRSSGRKGPPQMHLRSQSVPTSRDPNAEPPLSTSKFGTWGLGHKPVSEEWSDDFEFDEPEEASSPQISSSAFHPINKGTARGVRVPQAIIDRQASVHIQFGQVQEFMLLVEELKSLRARGAALQLLETHSKQLWKDAESIIDLATINNEEDEDDDIDFRPSTPAPLEALGDDVSVTPRADLSKAVIDEPKRHSTLRVVSSPATPPHGRPRGESLAFLQSLHQSRSGFDSSPMEVDNHAQKKLPFDTQDLKDLVVRSGVITRALKEIVRKAEGLSMSPSKTPPRSRDPAFSQIFNAPESSPCPPPFRKPGLPKSHSANSYLTDKYSSNNGNTVPTSPTPTALIL